MKRISLLLICALLCSALASCVAKPVEETEEAWQGKETFAPSDGISASEEALAERYGEYSENAYLAFKQNQPASGEVFEVEGYGDGVRIVAYTGSDKIVVIPESIGGRAVLALGEQAFASSSVRAVSVPDSVVKIEKGAFADCANLATLRLPFVGDGGENCHFGVIFGANSYENHAVKLPSALDMVILGDRVTEIADNAFAGCKMISAVVLPVGVERIGEFAFYECKDLVYISRNTAVKEIGSYAFGYCTVLYKAEFLMTENFGQGAFYECNSLRSLSLPFVGGSATENRFLGYIFGAETADHNGEFVPESLRSVSISAAVCKDIPDRAFAGCAYISEFVFDMELESIGVRAFYACRSLKSITLPDGVKTVGDDAFFGCDNLESAELGDDLESLGMQVFYGCRALKNIEIPEKVTELKSSAFAFCSSLESVTLNNVKKIGKDAFFGCQSLNPADCADIEVAEGNGAIVGGVAE